VEGHDLVHQNHEIVSFDLHTLHSALVSLLRVLTLRDFGADLSGEVTAW
jgi:hypothetical protein